MKFLLMRSGKIARGAKYFQAKNIFHVKFGSAYFTANVYKLKKCELSFANYAMGQVKKARGLNKKIVNPEPEKRKELIDFCYVLQGQGSPALFR